MVLLPTEVRKRIRQKKRPNALFNAFGRLGRGTFVNDPQILFTYFNRQVNLLDPDPKQIDLGDITHALSKLCRFAGHIPKFYSVAQHSVLVANRCYELGGMGAAKWGLLHDAAEAYIGDLIWPIKTAPGLAEYRMIEKRIMNAIATKFGLPIDPPPCVREADCAVFLAETRDFRGDPEWARERIDGSPWPITPIVPKGPMGAKSLFRDACKQYGVRL